MATGDDVWAVYAKNVKPIGKQKKPRQTPSRISRIVIDRLKPAPIHKTGKAAPEHAGNLEAPLDRNHERRLRQGVITIDARLDLHGMLQKQAHEALHRFIAGQIKAGYRYLLIITGKGRGGEGVLRAQLPGWLESMPWATSILALRPAAIRHGGSGAFYLILKKPKTKE